MRRRGVLRWGTVACAIALALPAAASAQAVEVGHVETCVEAVPAALSYDYSRELDVHVHVVLDSGVTLEEGRQTIAAAQEAYGPLGLRLVANYTTMATTSSDDTYDLFMELKNRFGGVRPAWAHVVYLLTRRDLRSTAGNGVAGQADCIGGVAFDDTAFAMGELSDDEPSNIGPLTMFANTTSKIAAHEVGHLFGAHHQYANCEEPVPTAATSGNGDTCTLMFNDVGLVALQFSALNGAIVRGHADAYAEPITAQPPPDGSETLPPAVRPCDITAFKDPANDHSVTARQGVPPPAGGLYNPEEIDILGGSFFTEGEPGVVHFRWTVTSIDGDLGPADQAVKYWLDLKEPRRLRIEVVTDGSKVTQARALEGTTPLTDLRADVLPGAPGVVDVVLPLEALGLAGQEIRPEVIIATTPTGETIDWDHATPVVESVRPGSCSVRPLALPGAGGGAPGAKPPVEVVRPGSADRGVRVLVLDESAHRIGKARRVRVRLTGTASGLELKLLDRRGRTVARGAVKRLHGTHTAVLRVSRRLRKGEYTLRVSGRTTDGALGHRIPVHLTR